MKLTVIGGGGVRSPQLARSLAQNSRRLNIDEIVFMDIDALKLRIYGGIARETARRIDPAIAFSLTTDPVEAIRDADYIITTIRSGGDDMRCKEEHIALDRHVLGQETTGAAGYSYAMRSVPALVGYCELAKQYAKPGVKVFNFTNPVGVVSQTLQDLGYDFTYGICDSPTSLLKGIARLLNVPRERMRMDCYGLNHLSFFPRIYLDGQNIYDQVIKLPDLYTDTDMRFFTPEFTEKIGALCNEYLYYFFSREQAVENILKAGITRGEVIRDINIQMTAELESLDPAEDFEKCIAIYEKWYGRREGAYMENETGIECRNVFRFDIFEPDHGGYAGIALDFIEAEQQHEPHEVIMSVPNQGAIPGLRDDDVVEITCTVADGKCTPKPMVDIPELHMELIRRVKLYERLGSKALRTKSIDDAVWCLMEHPLVNSYTLAKELVGEYICLNKDYTEGWR